MFGYVRPYKQELLVREFYTYKSVYCALCRQLGRDYGFLSRLILNYDCTFFALMGIAITEEVPSIESGRCCCNPLKRCDYCNTRSQSLEQASALSVISAYYKLKDNLLDKGIFSRLRARMIYPIIALWRKKACKKYPDIDDILKNMLANQIAAESNGNCKIDMAAEPTAEMFSQIMLILAKNEKEKRVFSQFGYFFGKWVYLIDAIDDYEKDKKSGDFNPFITSNSIKDMNSDAKKNYFNEVLNQCLAEAKSALDLIEVERFNGIIDNVIDWGLPMTQKKVIFDKKVDVNV